MLKYILLLAIPLSLSAMGPVTYPCKSSLTPITKKRLDPQRTMVAFDIDGVLLALGREEGYQKYIKQHPDLAKAIGETKSKYNFEDAELIIDKTIEAHPELKQEALEFKKLVFSGNPLLGTTRLVTELNQQGYGIIAASNMTPSTYQALLKQGTLPSEFSTTFFFVPFTKGNEIPAAEIAENKKSDPKNTKAYYEKPNVGYYKNLKNYVEQRYPGKYINFVFTDDKLENVEGARKAGLTAIHFKNPEQLRTELKELGVDIE